MNVVVVLLFCVVKVILRRAARLVDAVAGWNLHMEVNFVVLWLQKNLVIFRGKACVQIDHRVASVLSALYISITTSPIKQEAFSVKY